MSPEKIWYITTPIYYVNGSPHIGSAVTTLCCDVLTRYQRLLGRRTWFLTGTDEQATKVAEAAAKAAEPPREFVDRLATEFKAAWQAMHFAYDDFIRTTEPRHVRVVQEVFRRLRDSGDAYRGTYEGWYCVADETFFRESDVGEDHLCPNPECRGPLRWVQEESYFFRLSAYGDRLLEHVQANPDFLQPDFRRNEVIRFIEQGLRDMSITRANTGWGIPVADEPDKVIYVWFDALINYLAATGWPDDMERYAELWPADVHLMAKEIFVRFHATLWPAMLMALGLPLPRQVYAHGFWVNAGGHKEGKRTGGIPHPVELARAIARRSGADPEIAVDALRYLLAREMAFPGDTEFSEEAFYRRYNTDLANDLGNLCNRAVTMVSRYFGGVAPAPPRVEEEIVAFAATVADDYREALREFRFQGALEAVWRLVARMNRYIEERAPWSLAKRKEADELSTTLYTCLEAIRVCGALLGPYMPVAAQALWRQVGFDKSIGEARWDDTVWGGLPPGARVPEAQPLFPRIQAAEPPKGAAIIAEETPAQAPGAAPAHPPEITIDDFMKVELRVANVVAADPVPNADKLLKLTVELGEETRTLLAGIAEMYRPEELVGQQIVVVANLQPRKLRGVESQGMLLAADYQGQAILLRPETRVPSGVRVR
ncbi:MAG: methionine--tRNA ligase [Chthonomonadales bacterium]|nr:methionine--tRNA ligase [Chthonomonadales bacterium]